MSVVVVVVVVTVHSMVTTLDNKGKSNVYPRTGHENLEGE